MSLHNQNDLFFKSLLPSDVVRAFQFIENNCDGNFQCSLQSVVHHQSTIFVCANQTGEWLGIICTYKSPNAYNTAVIEGVVVPTEHRRKGIAKFLLQNICIHYKQICIFQLSIINPRLSDEGFLFLKNAGFIAKEKNGYTEYRKRLLPTKICVHNRKMRPKMNTINGEVSEDTLFEYFQEGDIIWGTYSGGQVVRGVLIGKMDANDNFDIRYMQHSKTGEIHTGVSRSTTEFLNDGRIVLYEDWAWTGNKTGGGRAVIEEINPSLD